MIDLLGPTNSYLDMAELKPKPGIAGIGLTVRKAAEAMEVVHVATPGPAQRAGIVRGDLITAIDHQPLARKTLEQAVDLLIGAEGTPVLLTLLAPRGASREISVNREQVTGQGAIESERRGDILIIRIFALTSTTAAAIDHALAAQSTPPRAILLDLRENGGGLLDVAIDIADRFLVKGRIVEQHGRTSSDLERYYAVTKHKPTTATTTPLFLLVGPLTAAGAEILAAALQDGRQAPTAGRPTFGRGTVESLIPLPNDFGLRLSTSYAYRPNGKPIADKVIPDCLLLAPTSELASQDAELDQALKLAAGDRSVCLAASVPPEPPQIVSP